MKEIIYALVIIIAIAIFIAKVHSVLIDDRVYIQAFDGKQYRVRNIERKQETADALARVNKKVLEYIERLKREADSDYMPMVMRLASRYNPDKLSEGRIDKRFTSYTVNKGEQVVLCLRSRDEKDAIYDDNLIFYVTLHELAHVASITDDHQAEFHRNFRYLLKKASEWNYWTRVVNPFHYCGLDVKGM